MLRLRARGGGGLDIITGFVAGLIGGSIVTIFALKRIIKELEKTTQALEDQIKKLEL